MVNTMTYLVRKKLALMIGTISAAALSLGSAASAGEYYHPAQTVATPVTYITAAAPITFRMANPNMMMGYAPQMTAPVGGAFDQSRVDPTLYPHQRVGNTYTVAGQSYTPQHDPTYDMVGTASWYGDKFHGKQTASGEIYDKNAMTAAHKTLPLNSYVIVTNMATGQSLKLRINDRGPFVGNRIIDLSEAAATVLGYKTSGLGDVRVQYAGPAETPQQQAYAAPVAPAPQYVAPQPAPAPQQYAQNMAQPHALPQQPRNYQPLRQQPQVQVPNIMAPAPVAPQPVMPQMAAPHAPVSIPEAYAPQAGQDDEFVTLTIKGPIHMAGSHNTQPQPRFIPAVNRVNHKTIR